MDVPKIATKSDWDIEEMPERNETFILRRALTDTQMANLHRGHIPQEMEDKWFWYMEGDTLYAHRSWTGFCLYIVEFAADGNHRVTVNRDDSQYACTSIDEDRVRLDGLLDWWSRPSYDYYGEWLCETVDAFNQRKG